MTVADKSAVEVADEKRGQLFDYFWSPDSGYIAYSLSCDSETNAIYIWSAADNKAYRVTQELFFENNPAWDPEGNYLYFTSDREFAPMLSSAEWNFATGTEFGHLRARSSQRCQAPFSASRAMKLP